MPTLNEVPEVAKLLATLLTGEPVTHGALAVIPLLAPNLDDPDWLTLDDLTPPSPPRGEGRVRGETTRARITEVSEAGRVPFLQVANGADRPLLLLDGEELIGAKQNRILNTTVLVDAHRRYQLRRETRESFELQLSESPTRMIRERDETKSRVP